MIIDANFSEAMFLPPCVEDYVPPDSPARLIRDYVELLDLRALGFVERKSTEGAPSYSLKLLLRVWLWAYFNKARSHRKAEALCCDSMGAIWLAGGHRPDHNTLWRFWVTNKKAITALYKNLLKLAVDAGQIGFVLHALDGTKVLAASSNHSAWYRKDFEKALEKLEAVIDRMEQEIASNGGDNIESGYAIEGQLVDVKARAEAIRANLKELVEADLKQHHPLESDARQIGRNPQWAYNCQAVADEQSGLVVAADVVNEANDSHQLCPMLNQTENNLGARPDTTVVDAGYTRSHQEMLDAHLQGHKITASLTEADRAPYAPSAFRVEETDGTMTLVCPQNHHLEHVATTTWRYGEGQVRQFRCTAHESCPVADKCMGNRKLKTIQVSPAHPVIAAQRNTLAPAEKKTYRIRRQQLIERQFGHLKRNLAFTRFSSRGLESVRAQWHMIWFVENLRTLWQKLGTNTLKILMGSKNFVSSNTPNTVPSMNDLNRWA